MQLSQLPTLVPLPFAANGTKNVIPTASQIGITAGAASLNDGFPPLTDTPLSAGGVPPAWQDFNGILNLLSANTQWQNAGGFSQYNAAFSTAVGGYPKTALLAKASGSGYWLSLADNNATDPDTGGAGWIAFDPWAIQAAQYITAPDTGAVNAYAVALTPTPIALTPGMLVSVKSISNTNTGAATLAVSGLSTLPILLAKNTPLSGGELTAGYGAIVKLNNAGTAWELIWTGAGSFVIAATASNQAVNLSQLFIGNRQSVFTANGTYTVPVGVTTLWLSGVAGGGGGGGGANGVSGGNGGGAGQPTLKQSISVSPGDSLSVTIGGGGANGGTGNAKGAAGGNTVLTNTTAATTLLTLAGGGGGDNGGAGSATINAANTFGGPGYPVGGQGVIVNGYSYGGPGGSSLFGAGGAASQGTGSGAVQNGAGFGAGGGGGGAADAGGNGSAGILIVEW